MDFEQLWRELGRELTLELSASGPELERRLGVSHSTLSRLVARQRERLLVAGRARATRYALIRVIEDVEAAPPIYEVDEQAGARQIARLYPVSAEGFYVESTLAELESSFHGDLPYFLHDMRPAGFLGRLVSRQHPELKAPADVALWSGDQCLRYLANHGHDMIGNLIVGERAFQRHIEALSRPRSVVSRRARKQRYESFAEDALRGTPPGSSAAGEQPKFLTVSEPGPRDVLVKFSPPGRGQVAERVRDLLVAEHIAHEVLRAHGQMAACSRLLQGESRLFLEVERFDRTPERGRRGMISLLALDAEFVANLRSWGESVELLAQRGAVPLAVVERVRWLESFGALIANTDLHFGNLSFYTRGTRVLDLAPSYDMLPMLYAPQHGNLPEREFRPPLPEPSRAHSYAGLYAAAIEFWDRVAIHALVSSGFRSISAANARRVAELAKLLPHLPA